MWTEKQIERWVLQLAQAAIELDTDVEGYPQIEALLDMGTGDVEILLSLIENKLEDLRDEAHAADA